MSEISLERVKNALELLKFGYKEHPSELERDGLIQRFELTHKLCWKTSKKILTKNGIEVDTPKDVILKMGNLQWISDPVKWINYMEKRIEAGHFYDEETATKIFIIIEPFILDVEKLIKTLESKNK